MFISRDNIDNLSIYLNKDTVLFALTNGMQMYTLPEIMKDKVNKCF